MATRLERYRLQAATLDSDARVEIAPGGEPLQPNMFIKITGSGIRIYTEYESMEIDGITIPDGALKAVNDRINYLLGTAI